MMARPASLAQIIIAGARLSCSSASAGSGAAPYSDGGLITALLLALASYRLLIAYSHCTTLQQVMGTGNSKHWGMIETGFVKVVTHHRLRNAKRLGQRYRTKFERRVNACLYIIGKTKKHAAEARGQQQQTAVPLCLRRSWRTRGSAEIVENTWESMTSIRLGTCRGRGVLYNIELQYTIVSVVLDYLVTYELCSVNCTRIVLLSVGDYALQCNILKYLGTYLPTYRW